MSKLSRALDKAIADDNRRILADPEALAFLGELGTLYRRVIEAQEKGFVQKPYPEETLEEFCARAGT